MHESTPAPSSPSRMSLDPCPGEHTPSEFGEASKVESGPADDGPITVRGDGQENDEGPEQHEVATPSNMGDEDPSVVGGEELIVSEQPAGVAEGLGDEGPSTSVGEEPNAKVVPEQHEAVIPKVAKATGNESMSTKEREEPDLSEHSGAAAPS
ncbi:hypothetical protein AMTR_s00084p00170470 [Amborella trichopoda]|uniref:Uncharacterized protein n=1 Tax=Amborella trichopoda TaxID=13333 RepID=W1P5S9_AMBTC|nr:hypothetical protein AMTR_s00084p00170470 [Amborella trichopoda]